MHIDLLAFPGHKGLLGPLGMGGLIIKPGIENILAPIRYGGTGSESEHPMQPNSLPDKYESGSHNMVGIAGLLASVQWILNKSVNALYNHELSLCEQFIEEIRHCDHVRIIGPQTSQHRCGVFSLLFDDNPHTIAQRLEESAGIQSRAGLHCAPYAHESVGTFDRGGTVRISFGPFHTSEDISFLTNSIQFAAEKAHI
jgi:selenocysteine lyase/cysteine desulfurase